MLVFLNRKGREKRYIERENQEKEKKRRKQLSNESKEGEGMKERVKGRERMSGVARKKLFYPLTILLEKSELIDIIISFFIRYKIFWI